MPMANQKGMALGTALFACMVLGLVTVYILNTSQNKRKIQENISVSVSADNIKNKLLNALNSKPSWDLTTSHNNIYPLAGTTITTPPKINIYDAETNAILIHSTNPTAGFNMSGETCNSFNLNEGHETCFFRYEVSVNSVTSSAGNYVVLVRANLLFKPRNSKFIFNSQKDKYSFNHSVGVDQSAAEEICESINGTFNATTSTCSQTLTPSASCNNPNQSYQGSTPTGVSSQSGSTGCAVTQLPQQTCATGQYLYGYDLAEHTILCRSFQIDEL